MYVGQRHKKFVMCWDHCDTALAAALLEHWITDITSVMSANRLKLNVDKTELLWTSTKHYMTAVVEVYVLEKTLSLPVSMCVFSVLPSHPTWVWTSMSAIFVQRDFSGLDNSVTFDNHLTQMSILWVFNALVYCFVLTGSTNWKMSW